MATALMDLVKTLEAKERHGAITYLVRQVRVVGLTDADYSVLFSALTAAGVPAPGSLLIGVAAANLVLTERNVNLVDEDKSTVDVHLIYEHVLNEGQNLTTPLNSLICGEVLATLNEVDSNVDLFGYPIVVQHTYPGTDEVFPDQTKIQGGVVKFFQAQITQTFEGIRTTNNPWVLARTVAGSVNKVSWLGGAPAQWMCTKCSWRVHDFKDPIRFHFSFEFQFNPDTWDPEVFFIDERTGKPPKDLIPGTGSKRVPKHPRQDFERIMGARVQGG